MIQQLIKLLSKKQSNNVEDLDDLKEENALLKHENNLLSNKAEELQTQLNTALDEITLNRTRIKSLLRQLEEKNGGSNTR